MKITAKKIIILIALFTVPLILSACFKDKGGAGANSVLNLTPKQKLHAVKTILNEQKLLTDEQELKKQISNLEKTLDDASGETKYEIIYYLTFMRVYYSDLMSKKKSYQRRDGLELIRFAQKDIDHFKKARYKLDEQKFLTGLLQ